MYQNFCEMHQMRFTFEHEHLSMCGSNIMCLLDGTGQTPFVTAEDLFSHLVYPNVCNETTNL